MLSKTISRIVLGQASYELQRMHSIRIEMLRGWRRAGLVIGIADERFRTVSYSDPRSYRLGSA